MKVFNFNNTILESWWSLLKHLNNNIKLELAGRLIESIKKPASPANKNEDWKKLAGAWNDENESAKDLILFLRNSRLSNRKIESFD